MANKPQCAPLAPRLLMVFLLLLSVVSVYFLKRWDIFSISLGALLIIVITEGHRLMSLKIDKRFDELENLIKSENDKTEKQP